MDKDYAITGFQSACEPYHEKSLSLDEYLQTSNPALIMVTLQMDLPKFLLSKGDKLIVDRSLQPKYNSLILTENNGEQGLFWYRDKKLPSKYSGVDMDNVIAGVVVAMIRELV